MRLADLISVQDFRANLDADDFHVKEMAGRLRELKPFSDVLVDVINAIHFSPDVSTRDIKADALIALFAIDEALEKSMSGRKQ